MDRANVERWFLRRGLPHLIDDYRASEDVYTRVAPLLLLIFFLSSVGALRTEWSAAANTAAVVGGFVVLVGIIAAVNRLRGRRAFQRPDRVGRTELAVFVLGPPAMALIVSSNLVGAAVTFLVLGTILAVISVGASFGAVPMVRWGIVQAAHQIGDVANLVIRTLPILLIFSAFLFINAEIWQVSADLTNVGLLSVVGLLVALGVAFLLFRMPRVLGQIESFADADEVRSCLPSTVDVPHDGPVDLDAPLGRVARWNVGLVLTVSQGLQILLAAIAIFAFYVIFGVAAIGESTIEQWVAGGIEQADVISRFELFGEERIVTAAHLRTAAFIAAFGGLHVTVAALTDATYREEFAEEVTADVRAALAVRLVYLSALAR
ncbi:MAG: hypothetical protein AAFZ07_13735 [Actinomycetota bacterium]